MNFLNTPCKIFFAIYDVVMFDSNKKSDGCIVAV